MVVYLYEWKVPTIICFAPSFGRKPRLMTDALYPERDEPEKMEWEVEKEREGQRNKPNRHCVTIKQTQARSLLVTRSHWSRLDCHSNVFAVNFLAALGAMFLQLIYETNSVICQLGNHLPAIPLEIRSICSCITTVVLNISMAILVYLQS